MDVSVLKAFLSGKQIHYDRKRHTFHVDNKVSKLWHNLFSLTLNSLKDVEKNTFHGLEFKRQLHQLLLKTDLSENDHFELISLCPKLAMEMQKSAPMHMGLILANIRMCQKRWADRHPVLDASSPEFCKSDPAFVLQSCQIDGTSLKYASDALKSNESIISAAIRQNPQAARFVSSELLADKRFIKRLVLTVPDTIAHIEGALNNRELLTDLLRSMSFDYELPKSLAMISDDLKNDATFMLDVLKFNKKYITLASSELRNNSEFMLEFIKKHRTGVPFIGSDLQKNEEFMIKAFELNVKALQFADQSLLDNPNFMLEAISFDEGAFYYISERLSENRDFILAAYTLSNGISAKLKDSLWLDRDFTIRLLRINPHLIKQVPHVYAHDFEIAGVVLRNNGQYFSLFGPSIKANKELALLALNTSVTVISSLDSSLKNDRDIFLKALDWGLSVFRDMPSANFRKDTEIMTKALAFSIESACYLDQSLALSPAFQNAVIDDLAQKYVIDALYTATHLNYFPKEFIQEVRRLAFRKLSSDPVNTNYEYLAEGICDIRNAKIREMLSAYVFHNHLKKLRNPNHKYSGCETVLQKQLIDIDELSQGALMTEAQKRNLIYILYLLTILISKESVTKPTEDFEAKLNAARFLKAHQRDFKNLMHKQNVTEFLLRFQESTIFDKHHEILKNTLSPDISLEESLKRMNYINYIWDTNPEKLNRISDFSSINLQREILRDFHEEGLIDITKATTCDRFEATFLSSRMPTGIYKYAQPFLKDSDMKEAIRLFIHHVIEGTLTQFRNEHNMHAAYLSSDQKAVWESSASFPVEGTLLNIYDTDDWQDLFLCGTEVTDSCQLIGGTPILNQALMSYVLDGKIRLLAIKDASGRIVSRSVLKLLLGSDDKPALLIERGYPQETLDPRLLSLAKEKARRMGVKLYEAGGVFELKSIGCPAPSEYEDAGVGLYINGVYTLHAKEMNLG